MAKIILNGIPMEADIRSVPQDEESSFGVERTDIIQVYNIKMPSKLTMPISSIVVVDD